MKPLHQLTTRDCLWITGVAVIGVAVWAAVIVWCVS